MSYPSGFLIARNGLNTRPRRYEPKTVAALYIPIAWYPAST
jgi:hypothetical protein